MAQTVSCIIDGVQLGAFLAYGSARISQPSATNSTATVRIYDPGGRWEPNIGANIEIAEVFPNGLDFIGAHVVGAESLGAGDQTMLMFFGGTVRRFTIEMVQHAPIADVDDDFIGARRVGAEAVGSEDEAVYYPRFVTIDATDYSHYFERMVINRTWTSKTLKQIVTDVVSTDMAEFGLSIDKVNTGPLIDEYTAQYVSAAKIMNDLAAISGYRWWVDRYKNVWFAPLSTVFSNSFIADTSNNWQSVSVSVSDEEYRNKVTVVLDDGSFLTRSKAGEIAIRGTWWFRDETRGLTSIGAATAYGDGVLRQFAQLPRVATVETRDPSFSVGEQVSVQLRRYGLVGAYMISAKTIQIRGEGVDLNNQPLADVLYSLSLSQGERVPNYQEYFARKLRS